MSGMGVGIRRVGIGVVVLLLALVGQLTWLQVVDAKTLANNGANPRKIYSDFNAPRGNILSADGQVLARSVDVKDEYGKQRQYPLGELVSQVVGYQSVTVGSTGLEQTYNDVLLGRRHARIGLQDVVDFFKGTKRVGNLVTSLRVDAQLQAKQALGKQHGSVVVIEPATGKIVALYSNPSYDPTPLASHDPKVVQPYFDLINSQAAGTPALPRAYREIYPPGSTFKVVTTTAAIDADPTVLTRTFPTLTQLPIPQAPNNPIANFGHHSCGGTLEQSFVASCNTTFAQLGLDLGERFPPAMSHFGIYATPPLDVAPGAARSTGPTPGTFSTNKPFFALAGIGQGDVAATPLQMALVASAIANKGVVMQPHVGVTILDDAGAPITTFKDRIWRQATSEATAAQVRDFMVKVVQSGTGTSAQIAGVTVAGKTGTAQTVANEFPHAWFVAFAPAEAPRYAVAVIVEHGGDAQSEATGGKVAAPIARQVLQFLLEHT
jgi:peptidoglycan glycosyltransferase